MVAILSQPQYVNRKSSSNFYIIVEVESVQNYVITSPKWSLNYLVN